MKQFLVLFNGSAEKMKEMMANSTPEERQKGMDDWTKWMDENKKYFADRGAAVGRNTRLTENGPEEVSNDVGGYSIMQAESKEELVNLLKSGPHFGMPGSYVEVMERVEM